MLYFPSVLCRFLGGHGSFESITAGSESQRPQRQKHHRRLLQADSRGALVMLQHNQTFATTLSSNCCTERGKKKKEKREKHPSGFVSLLNNLTFKHMNEYVRHLQIVQSSGVIIRLLVALMVNKTARGSNQFISCVNKGCSRAPPCGETEKRAKLVKLHGSRASGGCAGGSLKWNRAA